MIHESKCHRRTRLRIDDLEDELGRPLTYREIKIEFAKRGFRRPFRKIVESILQDRTRAMAPNRIDGASHSR